MTRFTKDQDIIDSDLPALLMESLHAILLLIFTVGSIISIIPWFLGANVLFGVLFFYLFQFFRRNAKSLKTIDNNTNAPIYKHTAETIFGTTSITYVLLFFLC